MGETRRRKTIGEEMGLKPLEPIVLKLFSPRELLEGAFRGEEEAVAALKAVMQAGASGRPANCLICEKPTPFPGYTILGRSASQSPIGFVAVACASCADSDTFRDEMLEAMGETEIKTSSLPS